MVMLRVASLLLLCGFAVLTRAEVTVYTAALIRTMEPALPEATAVAVEVGLLRLAASRIWNRCCGCAAAPSTDAFRTG